MAKKKRRRRNNKMISVLVAILLIIIIGVVGIITAYVKKYTPSDTRMDLADYYALESQEDTVLILQNTTAEVRGKLIDGMVYIPYDVAAGELGGRFYWDEETQAVLYTMPDGVVEIAPGSTSYSIDGEETEEDYTILEQIDGVNYLALDFLEQFMQIKGTVYENPSRAVIQYKWGMHSCVTADKETVIRYQGGIKSPILGDIQKGDTMYLLEELDNWSRVMTEEGLDGYVENKDLENPIETEFVYDGEYTEHFSSLVRDHKINLAWHQVTSEAANETLEATIQNMKGVNVISPTWFSVTGEEGTISSLASIDYVQKAKSRGMEVWGLIDNFNENVSTLNVLSSRASRQHIIQKLLEEAKRVGLDGINVDFEALTEEEASHFIQFIRELSIVCRKNNLVLSIDNPVPQFTSFYNRKEQGIVADYIIIMGYDEHTTGSAEAGSVASLSFVEEGITQTLAEVPKEKVINGVPFYTRFWREAVNGTLYTEVMSMEQASQYVQDKGMEVYWNKDVSQNYAEVTTDDGVEKIWLEDEQSLEAKMQLIQKYELAGVAEWKLGFERADVWDIISRYMQ